MFAANKASKIYSAKLVFYVFDLIFASGKVTLQMSTAGECEGTMQSRSAAVVVQRFIEHLQGQRLDPGRPHRPKKEDREEGGSWMGRVTTIINTMPSRMHTIMPCGLQHTGRQ